MALLAAYAFDGEGDIVADHSGNGQDFSLAGTKGIKVSGGLRKAAGSSPTFNLAEMPNLPLIGQTSLRTVMFRKKGTDGTWWIIWNVPSIGSGAWGVLIISGSVGVQARNATSLVRPSAAVPSDGQDHHYAGTYDGSVVRLYIDGVLAASDTISGPLRTDATVLAVAEWDDVTDVMDDLRIYDEALSQQAIQDVMGVPVAPAPPPPAPPAPLPLPLPGSAVSSGWYGLLDILKELEASSKEEVIACPYCGEPLTVYKGEKRCQFDGWPWRHGSLL